MVEVARSEQLDRLVDQRAMLGQDVGGNDKLLRLVRDRVEGHAMAKVVGAEIFAGEDRRILQNFDN